MQIPSVASATLLIHCMLHAAPKAQCCSESASGSLAPLEPASSQADLVYIRSWIAWGPLPHALGRSTDCVTPAVRPRMPDEVSEAPLPSPALIASMHSAPAPATTCLARSSVTRACRPCTSSISYFTEGCLLRGSRVQPSLQPNPAELHLLRQNTLQHQSGMSKDELVD